MDTTPTDKPTEKDKPLVAEPKEEETTGIKPESTEETSATEAANSTEPVSPTDPAMIAAGAEGAAEAQKAASTEVATAPTQDVPTTAPLEPSLVVPPEVETQIAAASSSADQPAPTVPSLASTPIVSPKEARETRFSPLFILVGAICLLLGLGIGYLLSSGVQPKNTTTPNNSALLQPAALKLPSDVSLVQSCADKKGSLYAKASDLPVGPIYMVHDSKVIGIEYMLDKNQLTAAGKNFTNLAGDKIQVNHVNIGTLSTGHEGAKSAHYHVDLYAIESSVAEGIKCDSAGGHDH